jgi:hypothetical protein
MTIALKASADGLSAELQVNGITKLTVNSDGSVVGGSFNDTGPATRKLAQVVTYQTGAVATGTTILPVDNTIPQITEGDQYLSLAITPTNVNSTLEIDIEFVVASSVGQFMGVALFQDATVGAIAAAANIIPAPGHMVVIKFKHVMASGSLLATTFKVRAGSNAAGTTTFNGTAGVQIFGGVCASRITIKEWLP